MVYRTGKITEKHPVHDRIEIAGVLLYGSCVRALQYATEKAMEMVDPQFVERRHPLIGLQNPSSLGHEALQSTVQIPEQAMAPVTDIASRARPPAPEQLPHNPGLIAA